MKSILLEIIETTPETPQDLDVDAEDLEIPVDCALPEKISQEEIAFVEA